MEKLDINLDDDFKNINTNISSNTDSIGIDLLIGGNSSPKSNMSDDVKSVKTDISDSHSFFKDEQADDKRVPSPMNDPIMNNIVPDEYKPVHVLSQTEIKNEKIDLLYKFSKLQNQGTRTSTNYNMNSNLDEMRNEYIKLKKQREIDNSIKFQRKVMMAAITGLEFLNNKFDPLSIHLDGWSESVSENIYDYDEVFEELYEKYGGTTEVAPEIKLLMLLGGSAFMFHLTNTMFKTSMPGMGDIMKDNPELMKQFASAAMGNVMGSQPNQQESPPQMQQDMVGPDNIDDIINDMNLQPNNIDLDQISIMSDLSNGMTMDLS